MISLNTIYDISTPLLGLGSIAFTTQMYLGDALANPTLTDISPMGVIMSLVGAFLLGLMRITNSLKSMDESNTKILQILADDSKKQDLILENQKATLENQKALLEIQNKSLDLETKNLTILNRFLKIQDAKKPGSSGTFPVNS